MYIHTPEILTQSNTPRIINFKCSSNFWNNFIISVFGVERFFWRKNKRSGKKHWFFHLSCGPRYFGLFEDLVTYLFVSFSETENWFLFCGNEICNKLFCVWWLYALLHVFFVLTKLQSSLFEDLILTFFWRPFPFKFLIFDLFKFDIRFLSFFLFWHFVWSGGSCFIKGVDNAVEWFIPWTSIGESKLLYSGVLIWFLIPNFSKDEVLDWVGVIASNNENDEHVGVYWDIPYESLDSKRFDDIGVIASFSSFPVNWQNDGFRHHLPFQNFSLSIAWL